MIVIAFLKRLRKAWEISHRGNLPLYKGLIIAEENKKFRAMAIESIREQNLERELKFIPRDIRGGSTL